MHALVLKLAPRNTLVNAIAPGFVVSSMSMVNDITELGSEWLRKNYALGHHLPLRQPETV